MTAKSGGYIVVEQKQMRKADYWRTLKAIRSMRNTLQVEEWKMGQMSRLRSETLTTSPLKKPAFRLPPCPGRIKLIKRR